ncbi:MAG: SCO family protein [Candidatus Brachytrichaceae bacterium NZ_4S206]|jgi:protein SCO1/2
MPRHLLPALGLFLLAACGEPAWQGIVIDPPRDIPAFTFVRASGDTVRTAPEAGRPTLVFFGYTHCPDVCPVTLADWARVRQALGEAGERVRWYFVTVDPGRDTPAVAEAYARQFDPAFEGLSGDSATVADIQRAFSVASYETPGASDDDYLVTHAAQAFLLDDRGRLVTMYAFNSGTDALLADLRRLLP